MKRNQIGLQPGGQKVEEIEIVMYLMATALIFAFIVRNFCCKRKDRVKERAALISRFNNF